MLAEVLPTWHIRLFISVFIGIKLGYYIKSGKVTLPGTAYNDVSTDVSAFTEGDYATVDRVIASLRTKCKK